MKTGKKTTIGRRDSKAVRAAVTSVCAAVGIPLASLGLLPVPFGGTERDKKRVNYLSI